MIDYSIEDKTIPLKMRSERVDFFTLILGSEITNKTFVSSREFICIVSIY